MYQRGVGSPCEVAAAMDVKPTPPPAAPVDIGDPHESVDLRLDQGHVLVDQGGQVLREALLHTAERGALVGGSEAVAHRVHFLEDAGKASAGGEEALGALTPGPGTCDRHRGEVSLGEGEEPFEWVVRVKRLRGWNASQAFA